MMANVSSSALRAIPGPLVEQIPSEPAKEAPMAAPIAAISSSAWNVTTPNRLYNESSCSRSEAGVSGYEPWNSGSLLWVDAAMNPRASAWFPEMLR